MAIPSCCSHLSLVADMMQMITTPIDPAALREELFDPAAGAYAGFEGWVRNENEGMRCFGLNTRPTNRSP